MVTWLMIVLIVAFVAQLALGSGNQTGASHVAHSLGLSAETFDLPTAGKLATFWLLHSPGNLLHLGAVLAGVVFAGRALLPHISAARLFGVFVVANSAGALVWLVARQGSGEILIGSAAGALGLMSLFAAIYPNREYRVLLLFVLPVTLRPKQLVVSLLSVDAAVLLVVDLLDRELPFGYAAPSHLAGALIGWCYYQFLHERRIPVPAAPLIERTPEAALVRPPSAHAAPLQQRTNHPAPPDDIRAKVDLILDKINSTGIASLTAQERRLLDEARNRLGSSR